jgi:hypothetical protein
MFKKDLLKGKRILVTGGGTFFRIRYSLFRRLGTAQSYDKVFK